MSTAKLNIAASVYLRILAFVLDAVLIGAIAYFVSAFLEMQLLVDRDSAFSIRKYAKVLDVYSVYIAVGLAYYWVGEQSSWQGSPLKRLMGLKVVRKSGKKRIHSLQVLGRALGKVAWLVLPIMFCVFIVEFWGLSEGIGIILMFLIWIILFIIWGNDKDKRNFYDYITATKVIQA